MSALEYRTTRVWSADNGRAEWQPQTRRQDDPVNPYWKPIGPGCLAKPDAEKVIKAHEAYVKEGGK